MAGGTGAEDHHRAGAASGFLRSARDLADLVFTDDMTYFDGLPEVVQRELGTPLAGLATALREGRTPREIAAAALLVEEVAAEVWAALPAELATAIHRLGTSRGRSRT